METKTLALQTLVVISEAFLASTAWGYAFSSTEGDRELPSHNANVPRLTDFPPLKSLELLSSRTLCTEFTTSRPVYLTTSRRSFVNLVIIEIQHNGLIRYFALGSFIFSLFAVAKSGYGTFATRSGRISLGLDSERAPLVG